MVLHFWGVKTGASRQVSPPKGIFLKVILSSFFLADRKIKSSGHFSFLNMMNNKHLQNSVKIWIKR